MQFTKYNLNVDNYYCFISLSYEVERNLNSHKELYSTKND